MIRALIRSGTNEFIFVVPDGVRAQTASGGTIVMTSGDLTYSVSLRLSMPAPERSGLTEALAEHVKVRYSNPSGQETLTATVADREGRGVQFQQPLSGMNSRLVRVLWVPFKVGFMEFVLNADSSYASAGEAALDVVLLTFGSNEEGRLKIVRRSDKT